MTSPWIDYATEFTFPMQQADAPDDVIHVRDLDAGGWYIVRPRTNQVLTTSGEWLPFSKLSPGNPEHTAMIAHDRETALTVAHRIATDGEPR